MIKDRKAITVPELVENEDRRAAFRIPFVLGICKVSSDQLLKDGDVWLFKEVGISTIFAIRTA